MNSPNHIALTIARSGSACTIILEGQVYPGHFNSSFRFLLPLFSTEPAISPSFPSRQKFVYGHNRTPVGVPVARTGTCWLVFSLQPVSQR